MTTATTTDTRELAAALGPRVARLVRLLIIEAGSVSRTQLSVLASLRDGPHRVTALAELERVAQPSMTALVSRLEDAGWVTREPDPTDGRVVNVAITPAGLETLDRHTTARAEALAARLAALAPEERAALAAALPALDSLIDR